MPESDVGLDPVETAMLIAESLREDAVAGVGLIPLETAALMAGGAGVPCGRAVPRPI
jgi:hypothetical protein